MRNLMVGALACVSSGCMLDVWAGGYSVKHPNESTLGFGMGVSFMGYIDPVATRTRLAVGIETDKAWTGGDTADTLKQNGAQIRLDVGLGPSQRSAYDKSTLNRLTAIVQYRGHASSNMMLMDPMAMRDESDVFGLYAGFTRELLQNPGKIWRDTVSWSVGPAYSSWRDGDDGDVRMYGAQVHFTFAASPLVIGSMLSSAREGTQRVGAAAMPGAPGGPASSTPSSSSSSGSSSGACPGGYYTDKCDVGGKNCKSVYVCP